MANKRKSNLWDNLERHPPYLVRMLAKNGKEAMSDAEVAITSGITIDRVREIKVMTHWRNVTIGEFTAFCMACAFDPTNATDRNRLHQYEYVCTKRKAVPFQYLRRSPKWESEFLPLLKLIQSQQQSSAA